MAQNKKLLRRRKEHREIFEMINSSDVTIQVLDARFPQKCRNATIEQYAKSKDKQVICCINKIDLISHELAEHWKNIISKELPTVFISALDRQGTSFLRKQIRRFSPRKEALVCVVGYPNVGKSSANRLWGNRTTLPQTMTTAIVSPTARAAARTTPEAIPGRATGRDHPRRYACRRKRRRHRRFSLHRRWQTTLFHIPHRT